VPEPDALWPVVLTAVLVATTVPLRSALAAGFRGRIGRAQLGLLAALLVQAAYLAAQLVLLANDLDRFSPEGSAYASIYFTLLGAHAVHVAAGMLLELWVIVRLVGGPTRYRLVALQVTVFYWLFVNVLAVIVVAVQLSPRL
jgi:cytochrome o ubiquinol oxidase subunit 3